MNIVKKKNDPQKLGRHSLVSELRYMNTYDSRGTGLDHAFIVYLMNWYVLLSVIN